MRHRKAGVKLKRDIGARRALLRGLVTNVIEEERITTTVPKAKAARPLVDKLITLAKEDSADAGQEARTVDQEAGHLRSFARRGHEQVKGGADLERPSR